MRLLRDSLAGPGIYWNIRVCSTTPRISYGCPKLAVSGVGRGVRYGSACCPVVQGRWVGRVGIPGWEGQPGGCTGPSCQDPEMCMQSPVPAPTAPCGDLPGAIWHLLAPPLEHLPGHLPGHSLGTSLDLPRNPYSGPIWRDSGV